MNPMFIILVNKDTEDTSLALPYATGRSVELFSATKRPIMLRTTKEFEKILKVKSHESEILDQEEYDFGPINFLEETKAETVVIIGVSSFFPRFWEFLRQKTGILSPEYRIMTGEMVAINLWSKTVEHIKKVERYSTVH